MRAIAAVVFALAFAPAAAAGLPNPCTHLTNAEVAKALGSKIVGREASGNGHYRSCTWTGADLGGYSPTHRTLMVQIVTVTKAQFDKGAREMTHAVRISGIGQEAYTSTGPLSVLEVWQKGYALSFIASLVSDPLPTEKSVAKLFVTRF
jgi:hypothetical protein